jgi:TM2 domain-containing membrane protein YozV
MNEFSADPDFSQTVIDDLYCYKPKFNSVALALAVFLGPLGAHRFYLGKTLTATLMLLSAGGCLIWWIIDIFLIKKIVREHNNEEKRRKEAGEPPQDLAFLPLKKDLKIKEPPVWLPIRNSKGRVYGSLFLLTLIGFILGVIAGPTGTYEPTIILMVFIVASLTAARWRFATKIPVVSSLTRWVHRLRLYYYSVDPGNIWLLSLRPVYGIFLTPFSTKGRAEVRLYLELGLMFSILFLISDFIEIYQNEYIWEGIGLAIAELVQTLIFTYFFVAPIGALLTTQILLSRRDWVIWLLSALCITGVFLGLRLTGGL